MISAEFEKAVADKNILRVRIMLKDAMLADFSMKQFNERFRYAKNKIPNLLVEYDGGELENDRSQWTQQLLNLEQVQLINNFSLQRIAHFKQIIQTLYADEIKVKQSKPQTKKNNLTSAQRNVKSTVKNQGGNIEKNKKYTQTIRSYYNQIGQILSNAEKHDNMLFLSELDELDAASKSLLGWVRLCKKL